MSTPGDYYDRCRERLDEARAELKAAQCRLCEGAGGYTDRCGMNDYEEVRCEKCGGSGAAPGYTYDDLRRFREKVERLADTGD